MVGHGRVVVTASPAPVVTVPDGGPADLSFVLVTYGTGPVVIDTLVALVGSLAGTGRAFEVIVVDHPHPGRPEATLTELYLFTSGVRVVRADRNLGFGGGCELGALHARGEVLVFVNPDVTCRPGWIEPLLSALDDPTISILAPVLLEPDGSVQEAGQVLHSDGATVPRRTLPGDARVIDVDYASAACWVVRRDEHERLGGFDAAYHPAYFEDVDLARRARALGGRCCVHTGSCVVHHRGTSTPDVAAPADAQRAILLATWPEVRWMQPRRPLRDP